MIFIVLLVLAFISYGPHTSEPYSKIGFIMKSNTFKYVFTGITGNVLKDDLMAKIALEALSCKYLMQVLKLPDGVNIMPR